MTDNLSLANFGWQPFFQQQLSLEDLETFTPARAVEQHRSVIEVMTEGLKINLPLSPSMPKLTVGDWVLLDGENRVDRVLERKSCFSRKSAGSKLDEQLIAANVDTAFIVCSLNDDFNLSRIERFLAMVKEAGVTPIVVLSKADLCADPDPLKASVQAMDSLLCVEVVNCLDRDTVAGLLRWCRRGETLAMLGSSGSGKSSLTNTLLGAELQDTGSIREDDAKGRHTTTRRSLLAMPDGAMILDTPGMRELQLSDCEQGVSLTFADIESLGQNCRFGDCQHNAEPGCAVQSAIATGELDERRLDNYRKLLREQAFNAASLAKRRASNRARGKYYKQFHRDRALLNKG